MSQFSKQHAVHTVIVLQSLAILFHLAIVTGLIPYTIVWAGKLESVEDMYAFETVSISINALILAVMLIKRSQLKRGKHSRVMQGILWAFAVLFALNTIGNLMAETLTEKVVFTPLTLLLAVLMGIIAKKDRAPEAEPGMSG